MNNVLVIYKDFVKSYMKGKTSLQHVEINLECPIDSPLSFLSIFFGYI